LGKAWGSSKKRNSYNTGEKTWSIELGAGRVAGEKKAARGGYAFSDGRQEKENKACRSRK